MYTTTRDNRTGYGNKAYRRRPVFNILTIDGWILIIISSLAILFLMRALRSENGTQEAWHGVLALQVMRALFEALQQFMVNIAR